MSHGIYSALSGALAQSLSLETTASNLANTSTAGYRAVRPVFHEVLARAGTPTQRAHFAAVRRTAVDLQAGEVKTTNNALDIALPKDAFLAVQTSAGERYTRNGRLSVSEQGQLVLHSGEPVLGDNNKPIELLRRDAHLTIAEDGEVQSDGESLGFLKVVAFQNPAAMTYEGGTLLSATSDAGPPSPSLEALKVGQIEGSNASPVAAMTEMMMASRMFEAMQRAIGTFREIDQRLVTTVPKA